MLTKIYSDTVCFVKISTSNTPFATLSSVHTQYVKAQTLILVHTFTFLFAVSRVQFNLHRRVREFVAEKDISA
jgi:hypothetical protein